MNLRKLGLVLTVGVLGAACAVAGTLRMGSPDVSGGDVTVPVILEGDVGDGVAALDFRLNYDPAVFVPSQVERGSAATAANKQVQANMVEPGEYVVIMMGMNQNTLQPGEVARITLQRVGEARGGQSNVSITRTTFASPAGTEIPSQGSGGTIRLGSDTGGDNNDQGDTGDTGADDGSPDADSGTDNSGGQDTGPGSETAEESPVVARNETDAAAESGTTTGVSLPAGARAGQSSSASPGTSGASPMGLAEASPPRPREVKGADSRQKLADAARKADETRRSIPTRALQDDDQSSGRVATTAPVARDGSDPASRTGTPGTAPRPADGGSAVWKGPEDASASENLQLAKVTTPGLAPSSGAKGGDADREAVAPPASASRNMKLILAGVIAAVAVAVFLVRRRLFS